VCNGILDNVKAKQITKIESIEFLDNANNTTLVAPTLKYCKQSVYVNNASPATGGNGAETIDEIKQNAAAIFSSQNRIVVAQDYISRIYAMPRKFGSIAKTYVKPNSTTKTTDIYVLGYNDSKQLQQIATTHPVITNLTTYLNQYRSLTEQISIKQGSIINIGVEFTISVLPNYNNNEILLRCINALKNYFLIDKWQIYQPIILGDIQNILANIKGVQTVGPINITSKNGTSSNYFGLSYDISRATKNGVIYTSQDPSIFEVKFPDSDIKGSIITSM